MVCFYAGFDFTPNSSTRLAAECAFLCRGKKRTATFSISDFSLLVFSFVFLLFMATVWNRVIPLADHPSNDKLNEDMVNQEL